MNHALDSLTTLPQSIYRAFYKQFHVIENMLISSVLNTMITMLLLIIPIILYNILRKISAIGLRLILVKYFLQLKRKVN